MTMNKINFLKPKQQKNRNISFNYSRYFIFFILSIIDFSLNNFLDKNITSFLPRIYKFFYTINFWHNWTSFN